MARMILSMAVVVLLSSTSWSQRRSYNRPNPPSHRDLSRTNNGQPSRTIPSVPTELLQNPLVHDLMKQRGLLPIAPTKKESYQELEDQLGGLPRRLQMGYLDLLDQRRWAKGLIHSWKESRGWLGLRKRAQQNPEETRLKDRLASPVPSQDPPAISPPNDGDDSYSHDKADKVNQAIRQFLPTDSSQDSDKVPNNVQRQSVDDRPNAWQPPSKDTLTNRLNPSQPQTVRRSPNSSFGLSPDQLMKLRQLAEAFMSQSEWKQSEGATTPPATTPADASGFLSMPGELSERALESFIDSLDQTTLDAMNNPKKWTNALEDKLGPALGHGLSALQKMNHVGYRARSEFESVSRKAVRHVPKPEFGVITNRGNLNSENKSLAVILSGLGLVALLLWIRKSRGVRSVTSLPDEKLIPRIPISEIRDRRSVVQACDRFAFRRLGREAQYWHHVQVFAAIARTSSLSSHDITPLREAYQFARYAPSKLTLAESQLVQVRHILQVLDR